MKLLVFFLIIALSSCEIKLKGIDLSDRDKTVYWEKLKNDVKFIILRAGYGTNTTDSVFEEYYKKCKQYCIPVGAYRHGRPTVIKKAAVEAKAFMERLSGKKFEYPIFFL